MMSMSGMSSELSSSRLHPGITKNQVIVLAGATSVGKSKVAQLLCEEHGNCEVIIADSVQIYKHLDIGSNKPSREEQEAVPHHLVDICEPHETYSSGEFVRAAVPIIYDILNRGKLPVVVGGSTMYLQWLVHGTPDAPKASEAVVRQAENLLKDAEANGQWEVAVDILSEHDGARAASLGKNDWYRMRRYLEVALSLKEEGGSSEVEKGSRIENFPDLDLRCYFLSEDREQLYRMIDYRCEEMLKVGLIDEVSALVTAGHLAPNSTAAKAIGYRQTIEYLGRSMELDLSDTKLAVFHNFLTDFATATRNYAKRQLQWYRKDKSFLWLKIERPDAVDKKSKEEEPYRKVAKEVLHWNSLPDSNFRQMIKHQMLRGAAVASIRGRMH
jgi:tRNA dimethylallyltransferase